MVAPLIAGLGTPELLIILAVVVVLFGASKLPDLARNSGQALKIFKAETKGLIDSDKESSKQKTAEEIEVEKRNAEARAHEQDRRADGV